MAGNGMKSNNANVVGYEASDGSQPRGQWLRGYPRVRQVVVAKRLSYNAPLFGRTIVMVVRYDWLAN